MGRFPCIDPLAERFAWVSPYNYAENEPVGHVDLWGLQKVVFDNKAASNQAFLTAYFIVERTPAGEQFIEALETQEDIDILFFEIPYGVSGKTFGVIRSFDHFKSLLRKEPELAAAFSGREEEYKRFFSDGKMLIFIGVNCVDECSYDNLLDIADTIVHELDAHALNDLKGVSKSALEEHADYFGIDKKEASIYSPDTKEVDENPRYKKSKAKQNLDDIKKILDDEEY